MSWIPFPEFERRSQALASPEVFRRRLVHSGSVAGAIVAASLAVGTLGYHLFCEIPGWLDCFYNASMILTGMGPVDPVRNPGGRVFASLYALYSGVALLSTVGIFLAPALHRLMHRLHIETEDDAKEEEAEKEGAAPAAKSPPTTRA